MTSPERAPLTRNQTLVFDALTDAGGPLSAYTILDQLREDGFRAPLQVYRALDKLVEAGLVHRLESLNAFVACSDPGCESHATTAFAICEKCGRVTEFTDEKIAARLRRWSKGTGFSPRTTTVELRGVCRDCRTAA
ncbi:Fur family transcriptional regulator [Bauldia sp.]|uniref:Fur family transcriptional regulator n=1 Tax=Bauldia sp. TaxID=2575872 RepID=UPI003BAC9249